VAFVDLPVGLAVAVGFVARLGIGIADSGTVGLGI
jgi:hypothetical protein